MRGIQASVLVALGAGLLTQSACEPTYTYAGYQMYDHFPLDADRVWKYANDSAEVGYELSVQKAENWTVREEQDIYAFEYSNAETGDLLSEVRWSSDSLYGVLIHSYTTYGGSVADVARDSADTGDTGGPGPVGDTITYDPPIVFASPRMAPGDSEVTETGGYTFTSSFPYTEACPNHWTQDWNECLRVELDDGDEDDDTGSPMAGTYWLVTRYGVAWFERTGEPDKWVLRDHDCIKGGIEC